MANNRQIGFLKKNDGSSSFYSFTMHTAGSQHKECTQFGDVCDYSYTDLRTCSPFRLEDLGLQDWHWALDDIDDDCSSIHF